MITWETVRNTLREIIDLEDKVNPLPDEAISNELKEVGIVVARRTVYKPANRDEDSKLARPT